MLAELSQAGLTVGLATSKLVDFAERIVAQLTIGDYFEVVAGAARDGTRITKTDIVAFALESLGRPQPGAVALVGDRGDDMRAAVLHGLLPVGVSWGYGDKEELQASGSQMIIDHPLPSRASLPPEPQSVPRSNGTPTS
jgi:phosphoglycolate phosphatase